MNAKETLSLALSVLSLCLCAPARAEETQGRYVRLAELAIDPAQMEGFKSAIKEGIETAVPIEPGVLALYAVAEKDNPTRVRVFEMYTDANAYQVHLETPHLKKFRATTDPMGPLQIPWLSPVNCSTLHCGRHSEISRAMGP